MENEIPDENIFLFRSTYLYTQWDGFYHLSIIIIPVNIILESTGNNTSKVHNK